MSEHHAVRPPPVAQLDDGRDPVLEPEDRIDAEAVHAEEEALLGQAGEQVDVGGVADVRELDPPRVDALLPAAPRPSCSRRGGCGP